MTLSPLQLVSNGVDRRDPLRHIAAGGLAKHTGFTGEPPAARVLHMHPRMDTNFSVKWLASGFALLAALGCNRADQQDSPNAREATPTVEALKADNTKKNERDRDGDTVTPGDQAENDADRAVTQRIRQAVVGKDHLSMNAKNVKIVTANGVVTLRGPVNSNNEKADIDGIARGTEGVTRVDNQLEVASSEPRKE